MTRFDERSLRSFAEGVLRAVGATADAAETVAASLIEADRRGVHTHGLVRLPSYRSEARDGRISVGATPRVVREHGPVATVDGGGGFGAVTGAAGMDEAIRRCEEHGVGFVTTVGGNHFGAASFYALRAVRRGLIGIAATSTPAVMAPWGGSDARIGNNPLAVAVPAPPGATPLVLDMAQSAVSRGRIKLAELAGEPIPLGWAVAADGRPTTDPVEALAGSLLPFGGHKGYGLAMAVEALTGVLAGGALGPELMNASLTGTAHSGSATKVGTVASLYVAVDPGRFIGRDEFVERVAHLTRLVKGSPAAPGFDGVMVPGELEARAEADAANGIPLDTETVAALERLGEAEGTPFPRRA